MSRGANDYINKVVFGNETLIDISADTVDAAHLIKNYTAHGRDGAPVTGTCTFDSDTTDANAAVGEILINKTAYVNKNKLTGTMPNNGAVTGTISTKTGQYSIPAGYHDGSGKVSIDSTAQAAIDAQYIKAGHTILGVLGEYTGEAISAGAATVTPARNSQTILPGDLTPPKDYISQVTVAAIPYVETQNAGGGYTATIG